MVEMGSAAQLRDAYGEEISRIGLHLRAWSFGEEKGQQGEVAARVEGGLHLAAPLLKKKAWPARVTLSPSNLGEVSPTPPLEALPRVSLRMAS
jgi:hypothetical protein